MRIQFASRASTPTFIEANKKERSVKHYGKKESREEDNEEESNDKEEDHQETSLIVLFIRRKSPEQNSGDFQLTQKKIFY